MKSKKARALLALTIMSMIVVSNSSGQTLMPARPSTQPAQPVPAQPVPRQGAAVERGKPRKRKISFTGGLLSNEERKTREKEMLQQIKEAMKKNKGA